MAVYHLPHVISFGFLLSEVRMASNCSLDSLDTTFFGTEMYRLLNSKNGYVCERGKLLD